MLGHVGHRADVDELVVVARDENDPLVITDVHRESDAHVREHHGVVEGYQSQGIHGVTTPNEVTKRK